MVGTTATILIPDISGFTEFVTNTELSHSSFAISTLITTIIDTVADEYQISEIEGDAVLMFKKGPAPSQKEIKETCLKIFNAFHLQRTWMQKVAICPCKACNEITHLTLKFIAHHGPIGEIKAGGFTKLSGTDVIVAHRLLKNSVPSNEYLLLTEKLLQSDETPEADNTEWRFSSDDYTSIGKVPYRFALLNEERKKIPEPAKLKIDFPSDNAINVEIPIMANYRDVYMEIMNIPNRPEWQSNLKKVEQQMPAVFIGSIHSFTFDNFQAIVSPLQMTISDEEITYAESFRIEESDLSFVHEYTFKKTNEKASIFFGRIINTGKSPIGEEHKASQSRLMKLMADSLKVYCEKREESEFEQNYDKETFDIR